MNTSLPAKVIEDSGVVSIIRMNDAAFILEIANARYRGGLQCIELPLTASNAAEVIGRFRESLPGDAVIGAGTESDAEGAKRVIEAGARFAVSPHFVEEVSEVCGNHKVTCIPGAFSPQEICRAPNGFPTEARMCGDKRTGCHRQLRLELPEQEIRHPDCRPWRWR